MSLSKKIAFAVVALLLLLALAEGALRLSGAWQAGGAVRYGGLKLVPDQKLLFRLSPGDFTFDKVHYRINARGWRGPAVKQRRSAEHRRVMFLGDSSVWGHGVDEGDSYPHMVCGRVQSKLGGTVEMLNAATPGYSSLQSRLLFEQVVDELKPDVVVVASLWSDLMVVGWQDAELLKRTGQVAEQGGAVHWSALLSTLAGLARRAGGGADRHQLAIKSIFETTVAEASGEARVSAAGHRQNLKAIVDGCKRRGIKVVPVLLFYDASRYPWGLDRLRAYRDNYLWLGREARVPILDVELSYELHPPGVAALFSDGLHPNREGHRIIADGLAELILDAFRAKK